MPLANCIRWNKRFSKRGHRIVFIIVFILAERTMRKTDTRFHADTAPVALATIDETLDRKEFSSVDDVQLQADRPVAGISDVCPAGVGQSLPKEGRLQD
jgi:hypothetical protein